MEEPTADNGLWIRRFGQARTGAPRLVCFAHAGGSASFFRPVAQALTPSVDVMAVQYPGRQDRRMERPADSIRELSERCYEALLPWTDLPLVFFGHSMGAVVGFEVATRLERERGIRLRRFFASGRRAPSRYRDEAVHRLDDDGIVSELKLLSGTDQSLLGDDEILRMILPALRCDYRAIETYRHTEGAHLTCPMTVLVGDEDPKVSIDEAADWKAHTTGECELTVMSGGHFFLAHHQAEINRLLLAAAAAAA